MKQQVKVEKWDLVGQESQIYHHDGSAAALATSESQQRIANTCHSTTAWACITTLTTASKKVWTEPKGPSAPVPMKKTKSHVDSPKE